MNSYVGEIRLFAGNYEPKDWAFCFGQQLPVQRYQLLYSIIGFSYGGGGQVFCLPDLRGKVPMQYGQGPGLTERPFASSGGSNAVSLRLEEMPAHNHQAIAGGVSDTPKPANQYWSNLPGARAARGYDESANTAMAPLTLQFAGGGQPHANRQPFLAMNYIICLQGEVPHRP